MTGHLTDRLAGLERYYDAVPRPVATTEEVGPFTLFLADDGTGWQFYARPRLGLETEVTADDVRRVLGDKVYATIIPRNVRIAESPSHGKPVLLYDYRCSGSQAYIRLASEVIERERRMRAA